LTLGTLLKYSWEIMLTICFPQLMQRWRTVSHFVSKFLTETLSTKLGVVVHHGIGQCRVSYLGHYDLFFSVAILFQLF